ncbi:hypothetical protein MS53_0694 [Mycoplasmopsis synoviae 53]|uniref:Uncharacterized protein n=1 Tax=Mycoplasmopsis synoviae (strain 53) TaxID=262723 RepID=A4Q7Z8_MYCS5|nr:hypothetical protein MS53_0694 [Mycoplasmopsis synoviae 53]
MYIFLNPLSNNFKNSNILGHVFGFIISLKMNLFQLLVSFELVVLILFLMLKILQMHLDFHHFIHFVLEYPY